MLTRSKVRKSVVNKNKMPGDGKDTEETQQDKMEQLLTKFFADVTNKLENSQTQLQTIIKEQIEQSQTEMTSKIEQSQIEVSNKLGSISDRIDTIITEHEHTKKQVQGNSTNIQTLQTAVTEIQSQTTELTGKVEIHDKKIGKYDTEIKQLKEDITKNTGGPIQIINQCKNSQDETLKFNRYIRNPLEFLKRIEQYFNRNKVKLWEDKLVVLDQYLENEHSLWLSVVKESVSTYDEFVIRFKNKYWSSTIQQEYRSNLEIGKYDPNRGLTASQYLMQKVSIARNIEPKLEEEEIVTKLARHFDPSVAQGRLARGIKTIEGLEQLVQEHENEIRASRNKNYNRFRGYEQNSNRGPNQGNTFDKGYNKTPYNRDNQKPNTSKSQGN